jgi:hypothetical protein
MTDVTHKPRTPYPSVRRPRKPVFTPAIWARWMTEKAPPDERTLQLRAGITEFRHRLQIDSHTETQS